MPIPPPDPPRMSVCRSCGADVEWVRTVKGARMPLDVGIYDNGNLIVNDGTAHTTDLRPGRRSHFVTCPDADHHRNRS